MVMKLFYDSYKLMEYNYFCTTMFYKGFGIQGIP